MLKIKAISVVFALTLGASAGANVPVESLQPVFIEGSQYTAVLSQRAQSWRLLPADGVDIRVSASVAGCVAGASLPEGIWLLTRDAEGRPMLTAPSSTALPEAYPEQVALRACGEVAIDAPHVTAPQGLIDWLAYNTGAIYVED